MLRRPYHDGFAGTCHGCPRGRQNGAASKCSKHAQLSNSPIHRIASLRSCAPSVGQTTEGTNNRNLTAQKNTSESRALDHLACQPGQRLMCAVVSNESPSLRNTASFWSFFALTAQRSISADRDEPIAVLRFFPALRTDTYGRARRYVPPRVARPTQPAEFDIDPFQSVSYPPRSCSFEPGKCGAR